MSAVFQAFGQVISAMSARKLGTQTTLTAASLVASILVCSAWIIFDPSGSPGWTAGGLAGICGIVGLLSMLEALKRATVGTASSVVAASSSIVIVTWSVVSGSSVNATHILALSLCFLALAIFSSSEKWLLPPSGLFLAVSAGFCFGLFVLFLDGARQGQSDIATLAIARLTIALPMALMMFRIRLDKNQGKNALILALSAGALDSAGNLFLLLALRYENLLLVGLMSAAVPVVASAIAALLLKERLQPRQAVALSLAVAGALLAAI